ncbi:helix-turn-helix domain-containing protein [Dethiobacter alkaliphilus]|uniref:helix-turn-helix domain-containing protein n=1 Tax=Dethiobacter alkaliphilus TaxID=427926 RepID=UPI002227B850|nr:helix-turn-helix transcriptional regulator [Dethiobacter alkaliphilus]MCW3489885.1 transcriptional regulator [Dethiobacter alkaliphilus]
MLEKQLKKIRTKNKLTIEELSKTCNLPLAYLKEVEEGKRELTSKALDYLLSSLDLDEDIEALHFSTSGMGDKLRAMREEKGLTLEELGRHLDLSVTYLSEIELGERTPSIQTLQKISRYFNVPISLFLHTEGKLLTTGKKIRMTRESRGMTQKQLAIKAQISPGLVAQLETGKVQPSLKTIERIAKALDVSVCYLILEQEDAEGLIAGISPELRELLFEPRVQMLIGHICTLDSEQLRLVLNFIHMLKEPALKEK